MNKTSKMKSIFDVMQNAVSETFQGYLVGDMLFFDTPKKSGNAYVFKPNVVEYKVEKDYEVELDTRKTVKGDLLALEYSKDFPDIGWPLKTASRKWPPKTAGREWPPKTAS